MKYELSEKEIRTVKWALHVLSLTDTFKSQDNLCDQHCDDVRDLNSRLEWLPYCEKYGKKYEDITEDDCVQWILDEADES